MNGHRRPTPVFPTEAPAANGAWKRAPRPCESGDESSALAWSAPRWAVQADRRSGVSPRRTGRNSNQLRWRGPVSLKAGRSPCHAPLAGELVRHLHSPAPQRSPNFAEPPSWETMERFAVAVVYAWIVLAVVVWVVLAALAAKLLF